ncbi:MAG: T9SS type A sorting domain-containing protein [Saprospiraceae bacterium]|nr:T9SS type A sorting domain-containing protein [Saprospiraceae bacterium]
MAFINDFRYYYFNTGCLFSAAEDISPAESNYCLHANPLRPGQAIQCPTLPQSDEALTLTLYGMAGQLLHRQAFWPGGNFQPTQPLAPGIYLLDIRTEKGSSVHRAKVVVVE